MSCRRRLDKSFLQAPVLPLNADTRYVLFSDCHRGNGTHNDNFLKNQHLYFAALKHYYHHGFTYIELGDGDELWENRSMDQIKEIHNDVFWQLSLFYKQNRLYMLYGNHDMIKKYPSFSRKKCSTYPCSVSQSNRPLFPHIQYYPGMILKNDCTGNSLYLTHGHQATIFNSTLWRVNCFLVRYLWKPLEQVGILDPTSAAKNYTTKQRSERRLSEWADHHHRTLITGHTHRPMLSASSHYINTGSCVHPRCITCIEVCGEKLTLVKWEMGTRENGNFHVERIILSERF
ncbi:MAG: metallophosphoesterase family protein [Lachnospiraceae bacterium]|nr:metallophosphoesterase family protein [Lachnospiraceae bacterium]